MKDLFHTNVIVLKNAFYTQGDKVSGFVRMTLLAR